ncbi:hypothetical protein AAF712_009205 [Marasmius tenuissimus]|uniref:F-box domain-containing protein n=1 Tax=Marasmius tenuissimus TaxID=585030 RepID=A0ABR2ZS57_9AGAR
MAFSDSVSLSPASALWNGSPIHNRRPHIPNEILIQVFEDLVETDSSPKMFTPALTLEHVCSTWRAVVSSSPSLWYKITVPRYLDTDTDTDTRIQNVLEKTLARSVDRSLVIIFDTTIPTWCLGTLLQHSDRWKNATLALNSSSKMAACLLDLACFPRLEILDISVEVTVDEEFEDESDWSGDYSEEEIEFSDLDSSSDAGTQDSGIDPPSDTSSDTDSNSSWESEDSSEYEPLEIFINSAPTLRQVLIRTKLISEYPDTTPLYLEDHQIPLVSLPWAQLTHMKLDAAHIELIRSCPPYTGGNGPLEFPNLVFLHAVDSPSALEVIYAPNLEHLVLESGVSAYREPESYEMGYFSAHDLAFSSDCKIKLLELRCFDMDGDGRPASDSRPRLSHASMSYLLEEMQEVEELRISVGCIGNLGEFTKDWVKREGFVRSLKIFIGVGEDGRPCGSTSGDTHQESLRCAESLIRVLDGGFQGLREVEINGADSTFVACIQKWEVANRLPALKFRIGE